MELQFYIKLKDRDPKATNVKIIGDKEVVQVLMKKIEEAAKEKGWIID